MQDLERFELRLPQPLMASVKAAADERGFSSVTAFIRTALQNELRQGDTALDRAERMLAASIGRLSRDLETLHNGQQAVFALTDNLARLFLTCVPEPPAESLEAAKRKARLRYERFMKAVAENMASGGQPRRTEPVDHE